MSEFVDRLRAKAAELKLIPDQVNVALMLDLAADEIDRLGAPAFAGQSFREIKQSVTTQCQRNPQDVNG